MKITSKQENSFLNNDFRKYRALLIFGADTSLVSGRISSICRNVITNEDSEIFSKIYINYNDILKDSNILVGHISSRTLLSEPKFIVVDEVGPSISKELKEIISDNNSDHVLVFKAGELPPSSTTRKFFEAGDNLAALACYQIDDKSIRAILLSKMSEHHIKCEIGVIEYIVENLKGEYLSVISEIDKIILYGVSQKMISLEVISEIISGSSEKNSYDKLIKYLVASDVVAAEQEFLKLTASGIHVVAISRNISNYFIRVLKVKELVSQKVCSETEAINSLRPPVFFKNLEDFKKVLDKYSIAQIISIVEAFTNLEIECKTTNIAPILCWDRYIHKLFIYKRLGV